MGPPQVLARADKVIGSSLAVISAVTLGPVYPSHLTWVACAATSGLCQFQT
jgi:hypothetical protein